MGEPTDPNAEKPYQPPPPFAPPGPAQPQYPQPQYPDPPPGYPQPGTGSYGGSPTPPPPPGPGTEHPALHGGYGAPVAHPPAPPARNNRTVWIVVAGLLVLIVAGVIGLVALGSSADEDDEPVATHDLRVPSSFGDYHRLSSPQAKQVEQNMRDRLTLRNKYGAQLYERARVGIYAVTGQSAPSLFFIGVDGDSNEQVQDLLNSNSPSENADSFLLGASVSESTSYPEGRLGGTLKCGLSDANGGKQAVCIWIDRSTLGIVLGSNPSTALDELAQTTLALRTAAEY